MNLVMTKVEDKWFYRGEGDSESNLKNLTITPYDSPSAGQMVDFLLAKYPNSRIRVEHNPDKPVVDANGKEWYAKDLEDYQRKEEVRKEMVKAKGQEALRRYFDGVE